VVHAVGAAVGAAAIGPYPFGVEPLLLQWRLDRGSPAHAWGYGWGGPRSTASLRCTLRGAALLVIRCFGQGADGRSFSTCPTYRHSEFATVRGFFDRHVCWGAFCSGASHTSSLRHVKVTRIALRDRERGGGAARAEDASTLWGQMFGLRVNRPRIFECGGGFCLHVDDVLRTGGGALQHRCCLGGRSRYGRLDRFDRPVRVPFCQGNVYAVHGAAPYGGSPDEMSRAMGVDPGYKPFARLAKALPPAYISYIFGQMAMRQVESEFGIEAITFDQYEASRYESRMRMRHLLRGAGGASPALGVSLTRASCASRPRSSAARAPRVESRTADSQPAIVTIETNNTIVDNCDN